MNRRLAPSEIRLQILDCLKNDGYRIFPDGQRFLDHHKVEPYVVIEDLIGEITKYEIFELPKQNAHSKQKYDYVIPYYDPEFFLYVKMNDPAGEPPFLLLTFHEHNIPGNPLPQIPIQES